MLNSFFSSRFQLANLYDNNFKFVLQFFKLDVIKERYQSLRNIFYSHSHYCYLLDNIKTFQLLNRLKGEALCDIKTKYAEKKRNPE